MRGSHLLELDDETDRFQNTEDSGGILNRNVDGVEDTQFGHSKRTADAVYGRNQTELSSSGSTS